MWKKYENFHLQNAIPTCWVASALAFKDSCLFIGVMLYSLHTYIQLYLNLSIYLLLLTGQVGPARIFLPFWNIPLQQWKWAAEGKHPQTHLLCVVLVEAEEKRVQKFPVLLFYWTGKVWTDCFNPIISQEWQIQTAKYCSVALFWMDTL